MKRKTTQEFINECKNIHNDKYDYSLVEYKNNKTKVKIICPIHGVFEQRPDSHLKTDGCPKCSFDKLKSDFSYFVKKSNINHNNKYKYLNEYFIDMNTITKIECPIHGLFEQLPKNHLYRGCNRCKKDKIGNIKRKKLEDFLQQCNNIHNNKYDYSLVKYKNNKTKIEIICPIHGKFNQRPDDHIRGIGCEKCKESYGEKYIRETLEKNRIEYISEKKFKGCKYKRLLPFDFYLLNYNICIEYDGIQHFKPLKFFGGLNEYRKNIKKDLIKNEYCKNNNIKLYRIKYTDNIEEKINEIISSL